MNQNGCRLPSALAVAASVLALSACSLMIPVGPMTSEERDIGEVSGVVLDTSGDLVVSEGEPALTVHAPEGAIDRLTSEVEGDTLVLGAEPGFTMGFGDVRYELTLPRLELIQLTGSGDVTLTGSAAELSVDLEGSGSVDAEELEAQDAVVNLSGSGEVDVAARDSLSVDLSGSGQVTYSGDPSTDVRVSGSGDVERR